jgi:hypothetical protein
MITDGMGWSGPFDEPIGKLRVPSFVEALKP